MKIPGMGNMMEQMQKMQEDMQNAEKEINAMCVDGEAGAGLVTVTLNGAKECKGVKIDDSLLVTSDGDADSEGKEMLEDLLAAAFNDASHKIDDTRQEKMGGLTSGMKMPAGLDSLLK